MRLVQRVQTVGLVPPRVLGRHMVPVHVDVVVVVAAVVLVLTGGTLVYTWVGPVGKDVPHFVDRILSEGVVVVDDGAAVVDDDGDDHNWAEVDPCTILYSRVLTQWDSLLSCAILSPLDVLARDPLYVSSAALLVSSALVRSSWASRVAAFVAVVADAVDPQLYVVFQCFCCQEDGLLV